MINTPGHLLFAESLNNNPRSKAAEFPSSMIVKITVVWVQNEEMHWSGALL